MKDFVVSLDIGLMLAVISLLIPISRLIEKIILSQRENAANWAEVRVRLDNLEKAIDELPH
jgi:hypothetical protein